MMTDPVMDLNLVLPFGLYLIAMIAVGGLFFARSKKPADYYLGGRGLNRWTAALSAQASDMSGWLLLGLPGYAYLHGLEAVWIAGGLLLGTYLNWRFVAARLREYTFRYGDAITLPHYFANRFGGNRVLRMVSALFILIFFLIYTASGFVAGAKLFSTVLQVPYGLGLMIGASVIIAYTFLGGFWAVSWTDVIQGSIMFFAILTAPIMLIGRIGGPAATWVRLESLNPNLLTFFHSSAGEPLGWIALASLVGWGLGYFGQPHILARFMAVRSTADIPPARRIAMSWVTLSLAGAVLVGLTAHTLLTPALPAEGAETVFMVVVRKLAPPFLAGCLLSAILAAVMSTADSQLLVASSALTEDFYHAVLRKGASPRELMCVSRGTVIIIAAVALLLAFDPNSGVFDLVSYAWAGFGAAFGPLVLFTLFWKKMTATGALAGVIVGGLTVLIWKQLSGGLFDLYEIVPGFIFSSAAIIFFSFLPQVNSKGTTP